MAAKHAFNHMFDCDDDGHLDEGEMAKATIAWKLAQHKAQESYNNLMDYSGYGGYYDNYYGNYDDRDYYYDDAMEYYDDGYYNDAGYYDDAGYYEEGDEEYYY